MPARQVEIGPRTKTWPFAGFTGEGPESSELNRQPEMAWRTAEGNLRGQLQNLKHGDGLVEALIGGHAP